MMQQTFVYQAFAFPSPSQLPSSPLRVSSKSVAFLSFEGFSHFGELLSCPGSLSRINILVIKLEFDFLLLISHVDLILRPARKPRKVYINFFLPNTIQEVT